MFAAFRIRAADHPAMAYATTGHRHGHHALPVIATGPCIEVLLHPRNDGTATPKLSIRSLRAASRLFRSDAVKETLAAQVKLAIHERGGRTE